MKAVLSRRGLAYGAALLLISNIFVKGLGFFYRVLLARLLGAEGLGLVEMVTPIYAFLLVLAGLGVQPALAQSVAGSGRGRGGLYFRAALALLTLSGAAVTLLSLTLAPWLAANFAADGRIETSLRMILPAILVISLASCWRGWFQGRQRLGVLGMSQNIEQVARVVLGLLLVAMGTYRSPAVALMPDVTPKPLRSKANAIINLMGAVGGIIYLGVAAVMYPNSKVQGLAHVNYQPLFMVVAAIMFVAVAALFLTVKEPKLTAENQALEKQHPEWDLATDDGTGNEILPAPVKKSLGFLLASIALWFMGYNGVTTWFTTYVSSVMGQGLGGASTCLLIATAGAIVSYIPIGALASRIGRRKTIMFGIILLTACFLLGYVLTTSFSSINVIMFIVFALVGLAWAAINVNSLPMVVEMCKGSDIGKFTGYYYTASMSAQVLTPILAGTLMRVINYRLLFPYAALFVALSFVSMLFVKHGDAKVAGKKGLDAFEEMDD